MHKVADQVQSAARIPLLHIGDVTAGAGSQLGRVGLLGTAFTMEQPFHLDRLPRHGLPVLVSADDSPVPVFATTFLHAEAAVNASLGDHVL
jgi:aspartate racemase